MEEKIAVSRRVVMKLLVAAALAPATGIPGPADARDPIILRASGRTIEVKGRACRVNGIEGPEGPGLNLVAGQRFALRLNNETGSDTLIHWHGLTPPSDQDGVPGLSQPPLPAGGSRVYDFANNRSGTHWMHSHVGLQEQLLLAAPLIVRETERPLWDEQEHVVMLHDFTFRDPAEILAELKSDDGHAGHSAAQSGLAGGGNPPGDVVFDAYLANDRTLDDPEIVQVERGGQVRLRIVNAAAASNMWIDLGRLEGELIAVDGNAVYPVRGSRFPIAIAQRADIRLTINESGAFPVSFQAEGVADRTGIILATRKATIRRLDTLVRAAPALDLSLERRLRSVAEIREEPVSRSEVVVLTGGDGYSWGFNGKHSMHEPLFSIKPGERVEIVIQNATQMAHPMHLHGHYFKVTAIGDMRLDGALRDTILVPAGERITIAFDADNPGTWAFHCHHLYHMNSGMMASIAYTSAA